MPVRTERAWSAQPICWWVGSEKGVTGVDGGEDKTERLEADVGIYMATGGCVRQQSTALQLPFSDRSVLGLLSIENRSISPLSRPEKW